MEARASWINETGGYTIGGTTYDIEIVSFDDQKDPKRAIAGMEKMAQEGIHYVVGPNVDDGAAAVRPVAGSQRDHVFPVRVSQITISSASLQRCSGYGCQLPIRSCDLQIPDG